MDFPCPDGAVAASANTGVAPGGCLAWRPSWPLGAWQLSVFCATPQLWKYSHPSTQPPHSGGQTGPVTLVPVSPHPLECMRGRVLLLGTLLPPREVCLHTQQLL